jgi:hypothetical protein
MSNPTTPPAPGSAPDAAGRAEPAAATSEPEAVDQVIVDATVRPPLAERLDPRRWSLGAKIGLALVLAALVPMAVLALFSLDAGREAVETAQLDSVEGSATEAAVAVRQYLDGVAVRADQLGTRADVVAYLTGDRTGPAPDLGENESNDVNSALLAAPDGVVVDVESDNLTGRSPRSVVSQDWFTEALSGLITIAPVVVNPASGVSSVTVAAPARNPGSGVVGVAAIDVRGLDVLNSLNQAQLASGGQSLLVDADGVVVVARDSRVVGRTLEELGLGPLAEAIDTSTLGTLTGVNLDGRGEQVAAFNEVYEGVTAVVLQPESVFLGPINRLGTITWFLFGVVGLLAVTGAVLLGRRLSRPVGVLTAAAVQIEANQPVDADELARIGRSGDDVGRLARVFAKMAEQVAVRERRLREQVKALKVEIDHERRQRAVDEVTDTDFFRDLQGRAAEMRRRAKGEPVVSAQSAGPGDGDADGGDAVGGDAAATDVAGDEQGATP